jgi:hypothetical protein
VRALVVLALLLGAPAAAAAQTKADHELGEAGQFLLTTDAFADYERTTFTVHDASGDPEDVVHTRFDLRLAIDRTMFARGITGGIHLGFEADSYSNGAGIRGILGGARVGWMIDLGSSEDVKLWPRLGFAAGTLTYDLDAPSQGLQAISAKVVRLQTSLPIVWRPVARVFVGGGPMFEYDVYSAIATEHEPPRMMTLGFEALLGVWFHSW